MNLFLTQTLQQHLAAQTGWMHLLQGRRVQRVQQTAFFQMVRMQRKLTPLQLITQQTQ
jgi:hypothetical protein